MKQVLKTILCICAITGSMMLAFPATAAAGEWQYIDSRWYYQNDDGNFAFHQWLQQKDETWIYLNGDGDIQTEWAYIDNKWYYFDPAGRMLCSQWIGDYYLTDTGAMAVNTYVDNIWIDKDGKKTSSANQPAYNIIYLDQLCFVSGYIRKIDYNYDDTSPTTAYILETCQSAIYDEDKELTQSGITEFQLVDSEQTFHLDQYVDQYITISGYARKGDERWFAREYAITIKNL